MMGPPFTRGFEFPVFEGPELKTEFLRDVFHVLKTSAAQQGWKLVRCSWKKTIGESPHKRPILVELKCQQSNNVR